MDVLVNMKENQSQEKPISKIVLERILVLAIAQEATRDDTKPKVVNAVTLEVTPEQAERLDLARSVGTLSLVLRNQVDTQALVTGGARPAELLSLSKAATADKDQNNRRGSRSGRRTSAPVNVHVHVEVLKGTERSAVEF